jgi:hypothetical protein
VSQLGCKRRHIFAPTLTFNWIALLALFILSAASLLPLLA